jgi:signal transduction histidine kinase
MKLFRTIIKYYILTFALLVWGLIANAEELVQTIQLNKAQFTFSNKLTPPDLQKSKPVILPHNWNETGFYGSAWYELKFDLTSTTPNEAWSIYLPDVIMNAQVWLNGSVMGAGGQLTAPISRYWHRPLMFSFPSSLIQQNNIIHVRVVAYTNEHAKLGNVFIGPESEIQTIFNLDYFKSVTLNIISCVFTFLLAALLFYIWLKRRDSEYLWFAIASLMWSIYSVNIFVKNIPISEQFWEKIVFLCSGWLAIAVGFLMIRLDGRYYPKFEHYLLVICCIFNVIILVSSEEKMFSFFPYWLQFSFLISCGGITHLAWLWIKNKKRLNGIILILIICIAIAGFHDLAVQSHWINLGTGLWLDYSLPLFFLIMGYLLVSRFLRALEETEILNHELENRIADAGKIIEENYRKILTMKTQQATTQERQRIHRDLHDSIGAKLLSLVYRSKASAEAELARSALNDLRDIVQQTSPVKKNLIDAIYEWKTECISRCNEAGNQLEFYVFNFPDTIEFNINNLQHIHSILTESVTNAIKHNKNNDIKILIRYRLNCLKFTVSEQSDYSQVESWKQGCGIRNMRFRISELNGKIKWSGNSFSGQVSWFFPIG